MHLTAMRLERVEVAAFCGLSEFLFLSLDNNKLTSAPPLCSVKCSLEYLDLGYNKISTISKNYLKGFMKLRKLYLQTNNIVLLPDLHWIQHSLTIVFAGNNYIATLDAFQTADIFRQLSQIDMGCNNIRSFNSALLHHMPNLITINLNSNEIAHANDFRGFYDKRINLLDNPWHCGMALSWMGQENMEFERGLFCATPVCLRGMAIDDMSKWDKPRNIKSLAPGNRSEWYVWTKSHRYVIRN